jgi:hypothetical protein
MYRQAVAFSILESPSNTRKSLNHDPVPEVHGVKQFVFERINGSNGSLLRRRYEKRATFGRQTMTNLSLLGTAAVLSIMFASSTPVQAAIYDSSACPNSSMTSANAPAPSVWLPRGCESSTKPWSAPVGHRQPQAADIPASISFEQTLDEQNARIDRVISGVCRGC